jgi:hypothetical protein
MAIQAVGFKIIGSIGDMNFYVARGKFIVRTKPCVSKSVLKKSKKFKRSREAAARFGEGAKIASKIYRDLAKEKKEHGLFGKLVAVASKALKEGKNAEKEVRGYLAEL